MTSELCGEAKKQNQKARIANIILRQESEVGGLLLPIFKTCYKARVITTVCAVGRTDTHISGIESPGVGPIRTVVDLRQRSKDSAMEKILFSMNGAGRTRIHVKKKNLERDLTPFTKINSQWITDLNVQCKTIKLLKTTREDLGYGGDFSETTPKARSTTEIIRKLASSKMHDF